MGRINKSYLKQLAERKKFQSGGFSTEGYKRDSPDVDNPYNIIPSDQITMDDVEFPVIGIDDLGYQQLMYPGNDYTYPGNYVTEFPLKNIGNERYGQMGFENLSEQFLKNWVEKRKIKDPYIQEAYSMDQPEFVKRAQSFPPVVTVPNIDNNPNITGRYEHDTGRVLRTPDAPPHVTTHEQTHYLQSFPSYMRTVHKDIVGNELKPAEQLSGDYKEKYDYYSNPDEVHSRIMVLREKAGFKPNKQVTEKNLNKFLKGYKGDVDNINDLLELSKDKKGLLNMLNYMAVKEKPTEYYGQVGFYKPDFRSKSQIAAQQGNTGESTKVAPKINPVDMRKAQEAAMQKAIANQPTFRQGRTLSASEQAENEARLAKIREQQEEEENRRRLTFTGNAEARGAGTLMQPLLDVVNPAALYYQAKDAVRGIGQTAKGVYNLNPEQVGSGLLQTGVNVAGLVPVGSSVKPALKTVSKYATTKTPLKNAYKLNPNLANPFGFKNVGDEPHWWKGYTQQVTPQNIDLSAGFGEWEKAILKNLSKGNYSKEQAQALLSKTPFSKSLGRGLEGTVYEFPNYPEYAVKIGQPSRYGIVNEEVIQELAPFTKQGNIAVPLRSSGQIKVPGAAPYQATLMQNLNKVGQPLNLSSRDAQALYLKQVRALRDAGYSLDMVNPANVSFNPRKGVYDIFDLSKRPSVAQDPKYLQKAYDFLKSKEGFQSGGTILAEPDYDMYKAPKQGNYLLPDINRPYYTDEQGGNRSEYKMGFNINGKETLLPTVVGGRQLTPEETINRYRQTGLHMGQYNTPEEAEYAARLRTAKYNMLQDPVRFNASMFQMGGTMGIPGVNGQVVSSGPQPLTSVKKTRGPISKDEKGNVKTMPTKAVKKILKNIK